jgi:oligopeptide transport system permease protein
MSDHNDKNELEQSRELLRKNIFTGAEKIPAALFAPVNLEAIKDEAFQTEPISFFRDAFLRFIKSKVSIVAFWFIALITILAIFGPEFNPHGFNEQDINRISMPPRIPVLENFGIADGTRVLQNRRRAFLEDTSIYPPGSVISYSNVRIVAGVEMVDVKVNFYVFNGMEDDYFWFGTDYLGRDLFTRLFRGARVSLFIAVVSVVVNVIIGVIYGAIAGYFGDPADMIMMRICEILSGIPMIMVMILFIMAFGASMWSIILSFVVRGWIGTAVLIRAQFYRFKGREYVLAARTMGVSDRALIFRHILPNCLGPLITAAMLAIPGAIFSESFLAYIGLGLQPPEPSIGVLLADGQRVLLHFPYQTFFPALLISILMISFNLFSHGLRDAMDPTKRGEE